METLVEDIMNLHASSPTFRQVFQSQQTTQLFVDGYKGFVSKVAEAQDVNDWTRRVLDKTNHLGLALALDSTITGSQKREVRSTSINKHYHLNVVQILDTLQSAHKVLNPRAENLGIDPSIAIDARSVRQRFASARFSIQVGERTITKTMVRMADWRKSIQDSERKRLRKTVLDL